MKRTFTIFGAAIKKPALLILCQLAAVAAICQPTITSVSPLAGYPASSVTITGTGFNATAANNAVFFGAAQATVTSASATSLIVTVPAGATYMPVSVDNIATHLTAYSGYPFLADYDNSADIPGTVHFNPQVGFAAGTAPYIVVMGDIDGDGKPDLVVANHDDNTISVYHNISSSGSVTAGSFEAPVTFATGIEPWGVAIGDIDGDGKPDLAVANATSDYVSVYRNTSSTGAITTASFAAPVTFAAGGGSRGIAIGDIDGDGKPDMVVTNQGSNTVSVFHNAGSAGAITTGSFAAQVTFSVGAGAAPVSVAIGDIDGDGKPDLAVADQSGNAVSVLRNTATGGAITTSSFATHVDFATGTEPTGIVMGDIDGDGKPDLVVTNQLGSTVSVLHNISSGGAITTGSFAAQVTFAAGIHAFNVAIGDMDGDGKPDLVVSNSADNTVSVFRNTSSAGAITATSFAAQVTFAAGGNPTGVAIGDIDGDGKADLVTANAGGSSISVIRNNPLAPVTGTAIVCAGSGTTLSDATTGGKWTSGNAATATVGSTTGIVRGIAAGSVTISYTVIGGTTTMVVTVNAVAGITSATSAAGSICPSAITTITANGIVGTAATLTWYTGPGGTGTNLGSANPLTIGPGTYYADVTGTCGATAEASVTVDAYTNAGITSATAAAGSICPSATTTITANGVVGTGATLTWYTGPGGTGTNLGSSNPLTVGPGTYYADVTGTCGATAEASVTVDAYTNAGITSATAAAGSICPSATTTITANGVVGTGATLTWYTGPGGTGTNLGSSNPLTVGPGTYYANVTGTCGAPAEASVTVDANTNVGITSATAVASPICPSGTTTVTANGIVGTAATLTWYTGPGGTGTNLGSSNPLTVGPGTYYADVTGTCGAPAEASVTVDANTNVGITSATAVASPICPSGTTTVTANGIVGTAATLTWYTGPGGTGTNLGSANPLTVGPGTYYADVTGTCGATAEASVTVDAYTNAGITSATAAAGSICPSATTTITANGVVGTGATLTWYTGPGGTGTNLGSSNPLTVGPGTYYANVTGTCGAPAEASVTVGSNTNVGITSATATASPICPWFTTTLTANGVSGNGASVTWYTGPDGSGANLGSSTSISEGPGTYYAYVTGGCGTAQASVTVDAATGPAVPTVTATASSVCPGGTTTITASGITGTGATLTWWVGGAQSGTNLGSANPLTVGPGTYTAFVNGTCSAAQASVSVGTSALPAVSISSSGNLTCTATSATLTASGASAYTWSGSRSVSSTLMVTAAGAYTVTGTGSDGCIASATYTETLTATPLATPAVTVTNNCGLSILTATGIVSGATVTWSPAGSGNPLTVTVAGPYTATQSLSGCTSAASTAVTAAPGNGLTLTPSITNVSCYGGSNGGIAVSVSGSSGPYTYSWVPCGGTSSGITGKAAGTYTVTVTHGGCTAKGVYTIAQPLAPLSVSGTVTNVSCHGGNNGSIATSVTGGTPAYTYAWSSCGNATATLSGKAAGTYDVTVTDAHGCSTTKAYTITQPTALSLTASVTNASCNGCSNGSINTTVSGGTPAYSYVWSNGIHIADPAALAAGTYSVTVTDFNGCTVKGSYSVTQPATGRGCGRTSGGITTSPSGIDISVIPNPNKGVFSVRGSLGTNEDQEVTLEVTNMLGQVIYRNKVLTQNGQINEQVQLTNVANGMYILNLSSGGQVKAFHIVVEQ